MSRYKIQYSSTHNKYKIIDVETNQTLKYADKLKQASYIVENLKSGGAFDGFTPDFFVEQN